jgi:type I pantothenate kinase
LAPPATSSALAVSDLFDFGIFVDARTPDIARWYEERFLQLQQGAFQTPRVTSIVTPCWMRTKLGRKPKESGPPSTNPTSIDNILPTKPSASLILQKEADHRIRKILLRRI